jgi:hypothetical protein
MHSTDRILVIAFNDAVGYGDRARRGVIMSQELHEPDDEINVDVQAQNPQKVTAAEIEDAIKKKLEKEPTELGKFSRRDKVTIICRRR